MRHCRRAYLAFLDTLLEEAHRDILPDIAVKVDDYGVDTSEVVADLGCVVVV